MQVSLCATAQWLQSLGQIPAAQIPEGWAPGEGLDPYLKSCETVDGRLDFLGPVVQMSKTPARWLRPPPVPGSGQARWIDLREDMHAA